MDLSATIPLMNEHPADPLYGMTLKAIIEHLLTEYTFEELGEEIKINTHYTLRVITLQLLMLITM